MSSGAKKEVSNQGFDTKGLLITILYSMWGQCNGDRGYAGGEEGNYVSPYSSSPSLWPVTEASRDSQSDMLTGSQSPASDRLSGAGTPAPYLLAAWSPHLTLQGLCLTHMDICSLYMDL